MVRNSRPTAGHQPPNRVGLSPRYLPVAVLATVVAAAAAPACSQASSDQTVGPVDLGMTASMAPYYSDENITIFEAQTPVPLPVRKPSASDLASLGPTPAGTPYPHAPWLTAADESLEVHYTLSNIDSTEHTVYLLIDPWNEFVRWDPGVTVVDDEDTEPNFGYDLVFLVPALSRVQGTLTTDDMQEIAIKLASVENLLKGPNAPGAGDAGLGGDGSDDPNADDTNNPSTYDTTAIANNIFNPQNRSNGDDPLYTPWIPPVIAGLTGFDLGIRSESDSQNGTTAGVNVAVEITIDVQDVNGNRFVSATSSNAQIGLPPAVLSPASARF